MMRRITDQERNNPYVKNAVNEIFMAGYNAAGEEASMAIARTCTMLHKSGIISRAVNDLIDSLFDATWEPDWYEQSKQIINDYNNEKQEV